MKVFIGCRLQWSWRYATLFQPSCSAKILVLSQNNYGILQDKYKINIYLQGDYPHDPCGTNICQLMEYLEKLYANVNMLFKDKLPRDLHTAFEIIKLFIKTGNLNFTDNKNTYHHFNDLSKKKLHKLCNEV